jgi:hypothetical protein
MRTLLTFSLLLISVPALAATRTWTIATQVETRDGELVAVRGETVYLKVGDQIQEVPLSRLSAADHRYIRSLALAPVAPGPASEDEEDLGTISPLQGEEPDVVQAAGMSGPELMPPIEPVAPVGPIAPASATISVNRNPNYQRMPQPPGQYRPTNANRRESDDEDNSRRARRLQQQQQEADYRANAQRNNSNASRSRRGLFYRRSD